MNIDELTQEELERLEGAKAMVARQAGSLDRLAAPFARMSAGDEMSRRDRQIVMQELALSADEVEELRAGPELAEHVHRNQFRTPEAYFFVERDGEQYRVSVRHGEEPTVERE